MVHLKSVYQFETKDLDEYNLLKLGEKSIQLRSSLGIRTLDNLTAYF